MAEAVKQARQKGKARKKQLVAEKNEALLRAMRAEREAMLQAARAERERRVREAAPTITKLSIKDEIEKALGISWINIYAEIENGNVELAKWCVEQFVGKPKQMNEIVGDVKHAHAHELVWRPERKLLTEESEMDKSDRLLDVLPRDVVEAELVGVEVAK